MSYRCPDHGLELSMDDGTCARCLDEHMARIAREVGAERGRWLVVYDTGHASRHRSKAAARREVATADDAGIPARLIRYRRDRVHLSVREACLIAHERWRPGGAP